MTTTFSEFSTTNPGSTPHHWPGFDRYVGKMETRDGGVGDYTLGLDTASWSPTTGIGTINAKQDSTGRWQSAMLIGQPFLFGRLQADVMLPKAAGVAPGFWLEPEDGAYGGWPAHGEIDIVEAPGGVTRYHTIIGPPTGDPSKDTNGHWQSQVSAAFVNPTAWHTWALDWWADQITMWLDGVQVAHWTPSTAPQFPWQCWQNMRLTCNISIGTGANWVSQMPPSGTTQTMKVRNLTLTQ